MKNGYKHRFEKTVGGILNILFTPADNIRNADIDPLTGRFRRISLADPEQLAECTFAENAAEYHEETDRSNGIPSVNHTLELHTDKIDRESDRLLRELADTSVCGLAAVVTTRNQTRLVIGYSPQHGAERPLRLLKISAETGRKHTDTGHEAIRLFSRDTARAGILDGDIG